MPSWLSVQALRLSGGRPGLLVMILSVLAGVISMFVDNVVVILMMAPVALPLARALKLPVTPLVLMIGFARQLHGLGACCSATCRRRCCTASPAPSSSTSSGSTGGRRRSRS